LLYAGPDATVSTALSWCQSVTDSLSCTWFGPLERLKTLSFLQQHTLGQSWFNAGTRLLRACLMYGAFSKFFPVILLIVIGMFFNRAFFNNPILVTTELFSTIDSIMESFINK
jgi:hypothetical protein